MIRCLTALCVTLLAFAAAATEPAKRNFEELQSVQAYDELMATMAEMRAMILADAVTEREAAEGMRFLLRTIAMSQDVTGDGYPMAPHFARMDTQRRKVGGDNPNAEYDNVVWSGHFDYRITGNVGSVDHLSFTALEQLPTGRQKSVGYLNERSLEPDANGNFTFWLSKTKPEGPGVWIQTRPGSAGTMLVRQYIGDREKEELARYEIEVVGRKDGAPLPPSTDAEVAASIRGTLRAINGLARLHHYVSPSLGENPNRFTLRNSDDFGADISGSDNLYVIGTYDIGEEEALVVEVDPMDVRYWNFAIENPWHESVDYVHRKTARTHDDVTKSADGKIRFLIAQRPADHPNFLETAGHQRGFMTFRWVGERDTKAPLPKVEKLPLEVAIKRR